VRPIGEDWVTVQIPGAACCWLHCDLKTTQSMHTHPLDQVYIDVCIMIQWHSVTSTSVFSTGCGASFIVIFVANDCLDQYSLKLFFIIFFLSKI